MSRLTFLFGLAALAATQASASAQVEPDPERVVRAAERGLRPVALHDALRAQGRQAMLTQFAADWFHPNDRGHRVWADAFWRELGSDIPRLTTRSAARRRPRPVRPTG